MTTLPPCIARYRADAGVFSDAGITPATAGGTVYQWNDLTGNGHHLIQSNPTSRPICSSTTAWQSSARPSIFFDGSSTLLNLPASLNLPGTGCAVLMCSRGTGPSVFSIGTSPSFSYGFVAGSPSNMSLTDFTVHPFPNQTYLPTLTPIVHGFRCQPALTRLAIGTNQTSDLPYDTSIFNSSGGTLGQNFTGDIYELAIFSPAPDDASLQQLLANLQDYNAIGNAANTTQIIFIGDSNIDNFPTITCELNANLLKPLVLAQPNHTIAQQQAVINAQLPTLDLSPFDQTIAVVCAGSNDAANGRTTAQIAADLSTLCATLQSLGMIVMLATIPDPALTAVNTALQSAYTTFANSLINWAADARLSDSTNTPSANDGIKAAILQPAIELILSPSAPFYPLNYASFYSAGQTFPGSFGQFVQS